MCVCVCAYSYPNVPAITSEGDVIYFTDSQAIPVSPNWGQVPRRTKPWYDTFYSYVLGLLSVRTVSYRQYTHAVRACSTGTWRQCIDAPCAHSCGNTWAQRAHMNTSTSHC